MRWCQTLGQKAGLIADLLIPHWEVGAFARCPPWQLESAMQKATTFEHGGKVYEVRAIPTLNGWKVRIFVEGIPAKCLHLFSRLRSLSRCCDRRSARRFGGRADGNSGA